MYWQPMQLFQKRSDVLHHSDLYFIIMMPMSASHRTIIHRPMLKFGGVESDLPSTSSLSNSLKRKSLNSPSDVSPSISFRENIVHLECSDGV